jgi:hypothetical protein
MSEEFSEVRGLNCLGNPETIERSADHGNTGTSPIGGKIWGSIIARGVPSGPRSGMGGLPQGKEILRKASKR